MTDTYDKYENTNIDNGKRGQYPLEYFNNYPEKASQQLNFNGWTECFPVSLLPRLINEFKDRITYNG